MGVGIAPLARFEALLELVFAEFLTKTSLDLLPLVRRDLLTYLLPRERLCGCSVVLVALLGLLVSVTSLFRRLELSF